MSGAFRTLLVASIVAAATFGEGGASPASLLVQHLLLALAVMLGVAAFEPPASAPRRAPAIAWLVFAAAASAGAAVAPYAYAAYLVMVEIAAFGAMVWLAASEPRLLTRVLPWTIAALAIVHGSIAVIQKVASGFRPASTFFNPNHLAAWLSAAALLLAARMADRDAAGPERWVDGAAVLAALAGIFVTGSRGAVLGLGAGAAVWIATSGSRVSARARRGLIGAGVAIVLVMALGVALRFQGARDPYPFHRTKIWAASLRAVLASPLAGTGPGQFQFAAANLNFPLEDTPLRYERAFRTPHSDVLRAFTEFGFPAGLAAVFAVVLAAVSVFKRRASLSDLERGALAALAALLAQAMVDDLSARPALTMIGGACTGLLLTRPVEPRAPGRHPWAAVSLLVLALAAGEIAGFIGWREASDLPRGRLSAGQLEVLDRVLAWNPMQPDSWERLAEHYAGDGKGWTLADYASAREAAEHARRLHPRSSFYARGLARIEADACLSLLPFVATRERTRVLYEDALDLARTDASIPLEESRFLLQAGDPAGARRAAENALRIEPGAAAPRLCLAEAILAQEGEAGAARARELLDEAGAKALRPTDRASSSYDAAMRELDPALVARIRQETAR